MGFFSDLKEDLSQAVNELIPEDEQIKTEDGPKVDEGLSLDEMLKNIDEIPLPDSDEETRQESMTVQSMTVQSMEAPPEAEPFAAEETPEEAPAALEELPGMRRRPIRRTRRWRDCWKRCWRRVLSALQDLRRPKEQI